MLGTTSGCLGNCKVRLPEQTRESAKPTDRVTSIGPHARPTCSHHVSRPKPQTQPQVCSGKNLLLHASSPSVTPRANPTGQSFWPSWATCRAKPGVRLPKSVGPSPGPITGPKSWPKNLQAPAPQKRVPLRAVRGVQPLRPASCFALNPY